MAGSDDCRTPRRATEALAYGFCVLLLLIPALWNGFPLLNYDTGGYLARWYEGTLEANRAVPYGLLLTASVPAAFWPAVVAQAAISVWIVALVLRTHELGGRPLLLVGIVAALTVTTSLPWLASLLLTDVFCGLGVLAVYLLLMRGDAFARSERVGLTVLAAFAGATHNATLAVLIAVIAGAALFAWIARKPWPLARYGRGLSVIALALLFVVAANAVVVKRLAWTPGAASFPFGRLLQDGIVKRYLDDRCPDVRFRLCAYKDELPADGDYWFWGSPLFDRLGRFEGLGQEMQTITLDSLYAYPLWQAETALRATARQLVAVKTGEGVLNSIWHTYWVIEHFTPQWASTMRAARQQQAGIDFVIVNRVHAPAALAAMTALALIALLALPGRRAGKIGELAAMCGLALVANAFICGALSNPHDRYGARIVWIAVLTVAIALVRWLAPEPVRFRRRGGDAYDASGPHYRVAGQ